jgi:putative ABC transport system permease protein
MKAVFLKAVADLRRRRLQAAVIFFTTLLAVATGTMALTLTSQAQDPYQNAFAAQKGAHMQVFFDPRTDPAAISGTPSLIGAAASGGPYRGTYLQFQIGRNKYGLNAIGRDDPGGDVAQLRITSGHWPSSDNEIALTRSFADLNHLSVGDSIKVVSVPAEPILTVSAEVVDIDEGSADLSGQNAWVRSSAIDAITAKDSAFYVMNYRFTSDPTSARMQTYMDTLRASLPPGSIGGSVNYLLIRSVFDITNQIITSVLIAFSVFALAATAAIVANLVTGIVISAYREIGIMKALGFTPGQVVGVFEAEILLPAAAACVIAIPAGTILSQPLLANSSQALGLAFQPTFSPLLDLAALVGALMIVALAALLPAFRAGLLKPAVVIANATAPRGASGRRLRAIGSRIRLPRAVVLGVGDAFSRPLRAALTVLAIFLGVATAVVALGVPRSFAAINNSETQAGNVDVVINKSPAFADADAVALIKAQPETERVIAESGANVAVPGITDPVNSRVFRGDPSSLGYLLVSGRWFSGQGEVVAPRSLLRDAHLAVGDSFVGTVRGKSLPLRVVGEVYDISNLGHELFMDWSTVTAAIPEETPSQYLVKLKPGSDVSAYVGRLAAAQPDMLDVQALNTDLITPVKIIDGVLYIIAAVIALIAVGGIFNTLLLNTRERLRDTATLKAVGMGPGQVVLMVAATAAVLGLVGSTLALPAGVALDRAILDAVSNAAGNDTAPASYGVFGAWELVAIALIGVGVAVAAALIPGRLAARTNVIEVLHAE